MTILLSPVELIRRAFHRSPTKRVVRLSAREAAALRLTAMGKTIPEIAKELDSTDDAICHVRLRMYRKLGIESTAQAIVVAARDGLIQMPDFETNPKIEWPQS